MLKDNLPVVSVILPVYNTSRFLSKCLDTIISQTYKNLDIICVNDGSTDNSLEILEDYKRLDTRISVVNLEKNGGLFNARLKGYQEAKGEYLVFIDSDDFIAVDYIRNLLFNILESQADIVCTDFIDYYPVKEIKNIWVSNCFMQNLVLEDKKVFEEFIKTNYTHSSWWLVWNKMYKKSLWDNCYEYFLKVDKNITYLEDFLYGNILINNARKFMFFRSNEYFYVRHEDACTGANQPLDKLIKYSQDKKYVIDFIHEYYKNKNQLEEVNSALNYFTEYQLKSDIDKISRCNQSELEIEAAKETVFDIYSEIEYNPDNSQSEFFIRIDNWDDRFHKMKEKIISDSIEVVSFDIFDTLILRPFFSPTDLFEMMDDYFHKITGISKLVKFSSLRVQAEELARKKIENSGFQREEVVLKEIYAELSRIVDISQKQISILMQTEKDFELKYASIRNSVKNLYCLAKFLGKKIICISDMYLDMQTVKKLLAKNDIVVDKIFLSSEIGLTKKTGKLFDYVISDLGIEPNSIMHIGDNWKSDIVQAREKKITAFFIPKTIECFLNRIPPHNRGNYLKHILRESPGNWVRYKHSFEDFWVRSMCAVIANYYFDNPFFPFATNSDFNIDPYFIGFFVLGMHNFGVAKWLIRKTNPSDCSTIHFVARDGYAIKQTYDVINCFEENIPKSNYIYMSRKSIVPLMIENPSDLRIAGEFFNYTNFTPREIINIFRDLLRELTKEDEKEFFKRGILLDEKVKNRVQYLLLADFLVERMFDKKKTLAYRSNIKDYFGEMIQDGDAFFDIGYSARAQAVIINLLKSNIRGFYIHTLKESAERLSHKYDFQYDCFFSYIPSITGRQREVIQSDPGPSCIGYFTGSDKVIPIFEDKKLSSWGRYIMDTIHRGSVDFAKTFCNIFAESISEVYFSNFSVSFAHEYLMTSIKQRDLALFSMFDFEDDMLDGFKAKKLSDIWRKDQKYYSFPFADIAPDNITNNVSKVAAHKVPLINQKVNSAVEVVAEQIEKSNKVKRALIYLLINPKIFMQKLKNNLLRLKNKKKKNSQNAISYNNVIYTTPVQKSIRIRHKKKKVLYYALSNFQLLCCLLHKIIYNSKKDCILILSNYRKDKKELIKKSNLFTDVYLFDEKQPVSFWNDENIKVDYYSPKQWKKFKKFVFSYTEKQLPFSVLGFGDYVFSSDIEPLGLFAIDKKIKYSYFEDSAGIFTRPEISKKNQETVFPHSKQKLIEKYPVNGKNKRITNIFLNKSAQIPGVPLPKNSVDFNVMELLKRLDDINYAKISNIFGTKKITLPNEKTKTLLLTQQMAAFKKMSFEKQNSLYKMLADFFHLTECLVIKPHPDDTYSDYKKMFSDAIILDPKVPSEFLPSFSNSQYEAGITVTSASILNLKDYIEKTIRFDTWFESNWERIYEYYAALYVLSELSLEEASLYSINSNLTLINNLIMFTNIRDKWKDKPIFTECETPSKKSVFIIDEYSNVETLKDVNVSQGVKTLIFLQDNPVTIEEFHVLKIWIERKNKHNDALIGQQKVVCLFTNDEKLLESLEKGKVFEKEMKYSNEMLRFWLL